MSVESETYFVVLEAMKGRRVDKRWMVAADITQALIDAGIIQTAHDELLAVLATTDHPNRSEA